MSLDLLLGFLLDFFFLIIGLFDSLAQLWNKRFHHLTLLLLFDCLSAVNVFRSESLFAHRDGGSTFYSHRCCKLGCHHIRHQRKFLRPNRLLRHLRLHRLRALPIRRQLTTLNLSQVQRWDLRGLQRCHTLTRRQCGRSPLALLRRVVLKGGVDRATEFWLLLARGNQRRQTFFGLLEVFFFVAELCIFGSGVGQLKLVHRAHKDVHLVADTVKFIFFV